MDGESEAASVNGDAGSVKSDDPTASSSYPFTTSQLEAAYLTNQLLRLHPEEFKKLMSLERSRQATLRWQFSSDPFDSVHEHQSLPYEIAMLASQEPRVQQGTFFFMSNIFIFHFRNRDFIFFLHFYISMSNIFIRFCNRIFTFIKT